MAVETAVVASAGDAEVAASAGFLGGFFKATALHLSGKGGLYGAHVGSGIGIGAAAAAAGALTAKAWADNTDSAIAHRLAEVRSHARLVASPDTALGPAMRQLLTSFDWCLGIEEKRRGGLAGNGQNTVLNLAPFFGGGEDSGDGDISVSGRQRTIDKEMRRQVRRIWKICDQQPPRAPPKARSAEGPGQKLFTRRSQRSGRSTDSKDEWKDPNSEAYEKLFNPSFNSVTDDCGLCAALCYLVGSFIKHRKMAPGLLNDGNRYSLRLAVAALARHPVFEEDLDVDEHGKARDADLVEFRRGALALIPLLDAALAWKPVDPWGWYGHYEDDAPLLWCEKSHAKGLCTFPAICARLRKSLNKAAQNDKVEWRRLGVRLDSVRLRELPVPWSCTWVQAQDASMLVRNHTRVPLRVELHKPASTKVSPWRDWPLLNNISVLLGMQDGARPIIVADVGPGIEWAMRPKSREGRHFELKLVTAHGVVVCSKRLRRGQTFDFEVDVPKPKRTLPVATARRGNESKSIPEGGVIVLDEAKESCKGLDFDADDQSVCSTVAPSSNTSTRLSIASSTASGITALSQSSSSRAPTLHSTVPKLNVASPAEDIEAAICPRCLREMRARFTRPTAHTYAEGVECDKCSKKILKAQGGGHDESKDSFFHCKRCWYDMCRSCAVQEMQDVWWGED